MKGLIKQRGEAVANRTQGAVEPPVRMAAEFIGQNTRKSVTSAQIEGWAERTRAFVQCSLGKQHIHATLTVFAFDLAVGRYR